MEERLNRTHRHPLHFIWILDCSGSMAEKGKIHALNASIRESIPIMQALDEEHEEADLLVRAVSFSDKARWHLPRPTRLCDLKWEEMTARGGRDIGAALSLVAEQLSLDKMPKRGYPPVLVLVSDGSPTDDYKRGLKELFDQAWGKKAVRIAIAIGEDAAYDVLEKFSNHPEYPVLQATNSSQIFNYIKWWQDEI